MSILVDVFKELFGMFVADARLTAATLIFVGIIWALLSLAKLDPMLCGGLLLVGTVLIVVEAAVREARRRRV